MFSNQPYQSRLRDDHRQDPDAPWRQNSPWASPTSIPPPIDGGPGDNRGGMQPMSPPPLMSAMQQDSAPIPGPIPVPQGRPPQQMPQAPMQSQDQSALSSLPSQNYGGVPYMQPPAPPMQSGAPQMGQTPNGVQNTAYNPYHYRSGQSPLALRGPWVDGR